MDRIRVLLAEDHRIVREGTRQLLEQVDDIRIVGEAGDGEATIQLAVQLQPDVIVLDVRMPKLDGIQVTEALKTKVSTARILILSAYEDDHYVYPLLEAGANGYLLKTGSGAELVRAIRSVHAGETAIDPHIAKKMVNRLVHRQTYRTEEMREGLSEREMEVLHVVAQGKSNKAVAQELKISPHTVQVHLRNIFGKLGVNSRTEAVTYAIAQGWLEL